MTVASLINSLKGLLTRGSAANPDGDAMCIVEAVLGYSRVDTVIHADDEVADADAEHMTDMARRRVSGEPIQYVIGSWSFMGRDYHVGKGALIPRDDTEVVTTAAAKLMKDTPSPVIVDLCSGTGIIAITLSKLIPGADITAVEKSGEAFAYLAENAEEHNAGIRLIHADLRDCAVEFEDGSLDMIVSNPPYIPSGEIASLQSEVQYEPRLALDGGEDGCDFYSMILRLYARKLRSGGVIAFEIGEEQFDTISQMLIGYGFYDIKGYTDIQGTVRAVTAVA